MTVKVDWPCQSKDSDEGVDGLQDLVGLKMMFEDEAPKMFHRSLVEIESCSLVMDGKNLNSRSKLGVVLIVLRVDFEAEYISSSEGLIEYL
jgi:hypothetical protein